MNGPDCPSIVCNQTQGHLGPIVNLNIDVLREIFLFCSPKPVYMPLRKWRAPRGGWPEPRLVVSHVCSSWRAITLHTPELWGDIEIGHLELRDRECLETWLQRSGKSPLSIREPRYERCNLFDVLDEIVLPNLHRCRRLTLDMGPTTLPTLFRLPPGSLQSLVGIKLYLSMYRSGTKLQEVALEAPITAFQMAHQLRRVELDSSHLGSNLDRVVIDLRCLHLPWAQLTVFTFPGAVISADSCIEVLRACVAIESCSLYVSHIDDHAMSMIHESETRMVTLPALHTLHLKLSDSSHHEPFLAIFHLPSLHKLELETTSPWQWPISSLIPVLTPAAHTLRSLYVGHAPYGMYGAPAADQDPRELLELLPYLTHFFVQIAPRWPLRTLSDIRDGTLGPRLERLHVGEIGTRELLDLAEGRLCAARASGGMVSMIKFMHAGSESPRRENPEFARRQALKVVGVVLEFELDPPSDLENYPINY
ncbi:hypothetical protein BD779DRAFT_1681898 [Infundibulicybe gibba]|nr:hypothetical protein BD779DRAFT_1681898 [Infundibulicybe gibba]